MSYILDALRKADAERDRGHVPNIHAQSAFGSAAPSAVRPGGRPWPWVLAASFALIAAGAIGWAWFGGVREGAASGPDSRVAVLVPSALPLNSSTGASAGGTPLPPPNGTPSLNAPGMAPPGSPPPGAPAMGGLPAGSVSPGAGSTTAERAAGTASGAPSPARPPLATTGAAPNRPRADAARERATTTRRAASNDTEGGAAAGRPALSTVGSTGTAAPTATATPSTTATAERVYTLAELPDNVRRELPTLGVGGSMYSPTPAARLLIVNGQVVHEGDAIAPGLVLRQIRLKSALLSYRDYRFEIRY